MSSTLKRKAIAARRRSCWTSTRWALCARSPGHLMEAGLEQYVNDRPYVASSHLSVAIASVFGSALAGKSRERPELAERAIPLEACIPVVPCREGAEFIRELFEPAGLCR